MKNVFASFALLLSTQIWAGYTYCDFKPTHLKKSTMQFVFKGGCDDFGDPYFENPEGHDAELKVIEFDNLNFGLIHQKYAFDFRTSYYKDGKLIETPSIKEKRKYKDEFIRNAEAAEKFVEEIGFKKHKFIQLKQNNEMSKDTFGNTHSYYQVYDVPGRGFKLGWKMKISKGKVSSPFQIFMVSSDGKEKVLSPEFSRSPGWTFAGGYKANFYTDKSQEWVILNFGQSWSGEYFVDLRNLQGEST